jgi:uncharacterized membrane protein
MCSASLGDPSLLVLMSMACLVGLALAGAVAYMAVRAFGRPVTDGGSAARALLDRRLAMGEIDVEEYYERESALRSSRPPPRRRRRLAPRL